MEPEDSFEVKNILEIQLADDSNYEVVRKIGSGAFGEVYEAIDLSTSKTPPSRVAIKIVSPPSERSVLI
jgi:serine/threonine protein kinase